MGGHNDKERAGLGVILGRGMKQYHTGLDVGDVGKVVLLPGSPDRVPEMAKYLEDAREVAHHREFCAWTGRYGGELVSIVSTGIGGPSAAIAVEELAALGVTTFIRTGTCGLLQASMRRGTLVVVTGSVRGGGTTQAYVPTAYPAVADYRVVAALVEAARKRGAVCEAGISECKDAFYLEVPECLPLEKAARERWELWRRARVVATEMESDTVLVVAGLRGARAGSVLLGLGGCGGPDDMEPMNARELELLTCTALDAVVRLACAERDGAG